MRYDPSKDESAKSTGGGQSKFKTVKPGKKVLHGLVHERYNAQSGTPMMRVWFVILKAYGNTDDEGEVIARNFPLTEKAIVIWGRFCNAVGYLKAHDTEDDNDVSDIIGKGPVTCEVIEEEYNGKKTCKPDQFSPYKGEYDPEWDNMLERGRVTVERIQMRMAEKRGSSGAGSSSAPRPAARPAPSRSQVPDDDIPF
jgi:hypothetical protein